MQISIRCPIYPTEDIQRVKDALTNIIGIVVEFELGEDVLHYSSMDSSVLEPLRDSVHKLRILDAVRKLLLSNKTNFSSYFQLDKQAACLGKTRVIDDSSETPPLGVIEVEIKFEDDNEFERFIQWFSPKTQDGVIIEN